MESTDDGLPSAIASAPSEGEEDTSLDTSGGIATVNTTIGGESHSELTDGDPIFQNSNGNPDTKNIEMSTSPMSTDDTDSMDEFINDAAKLVEKNNPEERNNIQQYIDSKTEEQNGEKIFSLFDDAAEVDDL